MRNLLVLRLLVVLRVHVLPVVMKALRSGPFLLPVVEPYGDVVCCCSGLTDLWDFARVWSSDPKVLQSARPWHLVVVPFGGQVCVVPGAPAV